MAVLNSKITYPATINKLETISFLNTPINPKIAIQIPITNLKISYFSFLLSSSALIVSFSSNISTSGSILATIFLISFNGFSFSVSNTSFNVE